MQWSVIEDTMKNDDKASECYYTVKNTLSFAFSHEKIIIYLDNEMYIAVDYLLDNAILLLKGSSLLCNTHIQ